MSTRYAGSHSELPGTPAVMQAEPTRARTESGDDERREVDPAGGRKRPGTQRNGGKAKTYKYAKTANTIIYGQVGLTRFGDRWSVDPRVYSLHGHARQAVEKGTAALGLQCAKTARTNAAVRVLSAPIVPCCILQPTTSGASATKGISHPPAQTADAA